ncbi:hypothetical protein NBRC10512_006705 [Rhodotorula toruloides]|uniref:Histone H1 n=2 Tax=Rhodotorula toruloides TaxID=5286 RepID=A0A061BI56_RHOTO|nr:Histone H1/H6 domain containing protein [Rhodotorula toruloides NP11]EMS19596.1 Histone H1/H6 domain containing protein [Rhodotorula toruloides NP11]CDR49067.1 RHTO0S22e02432g1_1 [Rhodotorula toruloides]
MTGSSARPPYVEMLDAALRRANNGGKVSRIKLAHYFRDECDVDTDHASYKNSLKKALERRMKEGYVKQEGQSFLFTEEGEKWYREEYETTAEEEEPKAKPVKSKKASTSKKANGGRKGK